jgi:hypothetical protein
MHSFQDQEWLLHTGAHTPGVVLNNTVEKGSAVVSCAVTMNTRETGRTRAAKLIVNDRHSRRMIA